MAEQNKEMKMLTKEEILTQIAAVEEKLNSVNQKLIGFKENEYYRTNYGFNIKSLKDLYEMVHGIDEARCYKFIKEEGEEFTEWFRAVINDRPLDDYFTKFFAMIKNTAPEDKESRISLLQEFKEKFGKRFKSRINAIVSGRFASSEIAKLYSAAEASPLKRNELEDIKKRLQEISMKQNAALHEAYEIALRYMDTVDAGMGSAKEQSNLLNQKMQRNFLLIEEMLPKIGSKDDLETVTDSWDEVKQNVKKLIEAKQKEKEGIDELLKKKREIRSKLDVFAVFKSWIKGLKKEEKELDREKEKEIKAA